ncbi:MAG: DNA adenine methylase [Gammaproteobacteria bacterium]|nr:DNA adenine methylase [Gammaproteobacteria bacterium]
MKYMGSKRTMLQNGLGELLTTHCMDRARVVDLFCGAGSVSWFSAINCQKKVLAVDLQSYATTLAGSVICRTRKIDPDRISDRWLKPESKRARSRSLYKRAVSIHEGAKDAVAWVLDSRQLSSETKAGVIFNSYGGYYYSPAQAVIFDRLLQSLPENKSERIVCLAAITIAASQCAASPGHTAQPFQPTNTAIRFIVESWSKDPELYIRRALETICNKHATVQGDVRVSDALDIADKLDESDLVFLDPPYSGVHYSRFYHVLETISRGYASEVSGVGRYPPSDERPVSAFSRKSESVAAIDSLLSSLASQGCKVIFTFPAGECSNGLSGGTVQEIASNYFRVQETVVKSRFSTMGGNGVRRDARKDISELILVLESR